MSRQGHSGDHGAPPALLCVIQKFMVILIFLTIIVSAFWVHNDGVKLREKGVQITPRLWSTLVFVCWIPFFPIYLVFRFLKWGREASQVNGSLRSSPAITNWLTI